jgi:hypothetical protein
MPMVAVAVYFDPWRRRYGTIRLEQHFGGQAEQANRNS